MKTITGSIPALAALGVICIAALPVPAEAASFKLNGITKCSSFGSAGGLTMDPAGNITITCDEGIIGDPGPPVCSISASPTTFATTSANSTSVTFSANCTQSPTSYEWGNSALSPAITPIGNGATGSTVFGPNTPAGTYAFSLTATNALGTGQAAITYTVTNEPVCPAGQTFVNGSCQGGGGGGGTQCNGNPDSFTYTGQFKDFNILKGSSASFRMPTVTLSGRHAEMIAFQSTNTPSDLQSEVAISSTCGEFNVPAECKQSGSSWSSIDLYAFSSNMGYCVLTPGTTYYVNVRNVVGGTDSCKQASCGQRLQYIGDLQ